MWAWRSVSASSAISCDIVAVPFLPMVLGVVLGFMVESNFRRALVLSGGDYLTFVQDPISAALLLFAFIFVAGALLRHAAEGRRKKASAADASVSASAAEDRHSAKREGLSGPRSGR